MFNRLGPKWCLPLLIFTCFGCESAEHKAERQRQEQAVKIGHDVATLSSRYAAVTDWQTELKDKSFSINVEPILVRGYHRPILFYAMLEDIRQETKAKALFFRSVPIQGEPTFRLVLDCVTCDLQALGKPSQQWGSFAVIAEPTAVVKLLDAPEDSPDYVVNGKFIDAHFVDDYPFTKSPKRD